MELGQTHNSEELQTVLKINGTSTKVLCLLQVINNLAVNGWLIPNYSHLYKTPDSRRFITLEVMAPDNPKNVERDVSLMFVSHYWLDLGGSQMPGFCLPNSDQSAARNMFT
ncbi:hypothetical protein GOODEAATRI_023059 [Goodea atripinnis]|uniref:Uncharacterized protein n=1 Tax=Goodea atripinnis TaxID=208336 RepID=A0ABV0MK55_9TELE